MKTTISLMTYALFFCLVAMLTVLVLQPVFSVNIPGYQYKNTTVQTMVNVTDARPEFMRVVVQDANNFSVLNVTLNAGLTRTVLCNATIRDWNGINGNITLNATFYDRAVATYDTADDENYHYGNATCSLDTGSPYGQNNVYGNYTCAFQVYYYANNATWNCTVFAFDYNGNATGHLNYTVNASNSTIVLPLYALNVTEGINFGEMAVGETSSEIQANVTNFGNRQINVTVQAYGNTTGDGMALICNLSIATNNISIANEATSIYGSTPFASKMAMNGTVQLVSNLTLVQQTSTQVINTTYWQLQIPISINPFGYCTGWVIFSAITA